MTTPVNPELLVCAGEFFTDFIFFDLDQLPSLGQETKNDNFAASLGGGAAITAVAAALLGRTTELVTVWGESLLDAEARRRLDEAGVAWSWSRINRNEMSGVSVAVSTREDRYFLTHPGANHAVEEHLLSPETHERASLAGHVHFALTPSRWDAFGDAIKQIRKNGATVSWDLGWDPEVGRSQGFRELCLDLDLLFLNEMEACKYAGVSSAQEAVAYFRRAHNTVVIKQGAAGAIASRSAATPVQVEGIEVDAVESTGAGDAFDGGFLHAWMAGRGLEEALLWGNICGGLSTRLPGGIEALPNREEFDHRLDGLAGEGITGRRLG